MIWLHQIMYDLIVLKKIVDLYFVRVASYTHLRVGEPMIIANCVYVLYIFPVFNNKNKRKQSVDLQLLILMMSNSFQQTFRTSYKKQNH